MSWSSVFAARLRGLLLQRRPERELDDEVRFHLEMQAEDNRRAGMNAAEARYAAMRSFGGVETMKEAFRERRTFALVETVVQDVAHGARSLGRRPGFTIAAGLSLALGIGVTTAIFTVLNAVALRPLPYADAGRLIWMTQILKKNSTDEVTLTAHFLEWRRQNRTFVDLAGYNYQTRNLTGLDEPMQLRTAKVSASLLPLLGVQPVLGRNFLKQEDYKGHDQVALLGNELWQQRFGGNREIVGQTITLDGSPFTIVGVLPPGFAFPGPDPVQLIAPLGKDEAAELQYKVGSIVLNVIGRLKPGVTLEQARADLAVVQSRLPLPAFRPTIAVKMLTLREYLFGDVKTAGFLLVAAAGFLLLIACANVSNLLLARWMQRDRELAIRSALGGSRARLVCQLLTESALLGAVACAAGIALAFWARRPLLALSPYHLAGLRNLPFDGRVLGFAVALGMLTTVLFGLLPAFRATKVHLAEAIKAGEAAVVGGRGSLRVLSMIAAAEIATILVLSTGAGLMLQSFWRMRYMNLGFQPDRLVVATLNLSGPAYREPARRSAFIHELLERAQSLPGVELAAVTRAGEVPPGDFHAHATNSFAIEGREQPLGGSRPIARYPVVSSNYFAMMGIPLLQGRLLQDSDGENTPPVAIVNSALVRRYFERENPIGKRVRTGADDQPWRTIAGVVGDVKTSGLASAAEPAIYLPYLQAGALAEIGLVMRSPLHPGTVAAELRKTISSLDPNQPVASVQAMGDRLSQSVSGPRFTSVLLFAFAGLAIVLGLIGVYGVMGCRIRWQLRELAVRQALGAQPKDIIRHVLRQGFAMILPGLLTGLLGALWLSRLLSGMLYEVPVHDPLTFAAVSTGLAGVALLACWIPAMRAARSDPLQLLRHD
jgi:putative ABC transport system permease protein